jgi:TonB family protein
MRLLILALSLSVATSVTTPEALSAKDLQAELRARYVGKTLLLRGFYSDGDLRYDQSGGLVGRKAVGDWTTNGFVVVEGISSHGTRLIIKGKRLVILWSDGKFRVAEKKEHGEVTKIGSSIHIEVDLGTDSPAFEQADALLSRVFLKAQDRLADLVPLYWKSCITKGLTGAGGNCSFSDELLQVPGVALAGRDAPAAAAGEQESASSQPTFHMGKGVSPPRVIHSPEPEFTSRARELKYQGTMTLGLIVDREGRATNIHVVVPLGCGLDEHAVQAVQGWKFTPAMKDGNPVPFEIAVEVDFHLY